MTARTLILAAILMLGSWPGAWAAGRLEAVRGRGEVRICIWPDTFAVTYRNPRTGELDGIDMDMARAFAASLGVTPRFVDSSAADLVATMTNNACDVAMSAVDIRPDRAEYMDFTRPHLASGLYAIAAINNSTLRQWADLDRPGRVVVVVKGTVAEPVMRDMLKTAELKIVDDFAAGEQDVQNGRADALMADYLYGRRMTALTEWARMIEPPHRLHPTPRAYAVPKNDPEWLKAVDDFVATVKADGRLRKAAIRHGLTPILVNK